jgi:hypothetical protein
MEKEAAGIAHHGSTLLLPNHGRKAFNPFRGRNKG